MKKILLSLICTLFAALGAMAQTYTDHLVVTVNDESSEPMQATVNYTDNGNGTCNFSLPNFVLGSGDEAIPVGNINIDNIPLSAPVNGVSSFEFKGDITIAAGDDPTKDFWFGPELGVLPLDLKGKVSADKIYVSIDLDLMESLEQIIYVQFGDDNFPTGPVAGEKSGIYLRGTFNGWGTSDEAEFLTTTTAGVYEIKDLTFANGSDGFKVADANWGDINFGGNGTLTIGQPYTLVAGGGNIKLPTDNEYKCSVITLDMNAKTLTVVGEEGGKVVETVDFVALAGTSAFIGADWDPAAEEGRMKETIDASFGGVFRTFEWSKVDVPAGDHQFKFTANGAWDINWGVASCQFDTENSIVRGGENAFFTLSDPAEIKVELTIYPADLSNGKYTIKTVSPDGIATIIAQGTVNVYDLQGRRVSRAQSGVAIENGRKMIRK